MSDIVEMLRAWADEEREHDPISYGSQEQVMSEAADEITRLRADNERLQQMQADGQTGFELLAEENRSLRAALVDARECVEAWAGYASDYFRDKHDLAGDLARIDAALAAQPAPKEVSVDHA